MRKKRFWKLWSQNRGFEGEMSLCFIQLAHKVPLLGSFSTARDSGTRRSRRVRERAEPPPQTLLLYKSVGGKGEGWLPLVKVKGHLGGYSYIHVCVFSQFIEPAGFEGLFPFWGRSKRDMRKQKYNFFFFAQWFDIFVGGI